MFLGPNIDDPCILRYLQATSPYSHYTYSQALTSYTSFLSRFDHCNALSKGKCIANELYRTRVFMNTLARSHGVHRRHSDSRDQKQSFLSHQSILEV